MYIYEKNVYHIRQTFFASFIRVLLKLEHNSLEPEDSDGSPAATGHVRLILVRSPDVKLRLKFECLGCMLPRKYEWELHIKLQTN